MFMDVLREHRRGLTHDDINDKMREVLAGVEEEGKSGSLTLKFTFSPRAKGEGIDVAVAINANPPKPEAATSIFYLTPNGDLQRQDPRQADMDLREVPPASIAKALA